MFFVPNELTTQLNIIVVMNCDLSYLLIRYIWCLPVNCVFWLHLLVPFYDSYLCVPYSLNTWYGNIFSRFDVSLLLVLKEDIILCASQSFDKQKKASLFFVKWCWIRLMFQIWMIPAHSLWNVISSLIIKIWQPIGKI